MLLYLGITLFLLIILVFSIVEFKDDFGLKKKGRIFFSNYLHKILFIAIVFFLWFLTAFRSGNIGNDTQNYLNYYENIAKDGITKNLSIEFGYQIYCWLLSRIFSNPYFLLVISATICYSISAIYIYKHSKNILFSTILLFCVAFSFFTSGLRQALAMVIVLIAYYKIKEGKKILPIALILVASTFHISALITFLWFGHKFIFKKPLWVIASASVLIILSASGLLNNLLKLILKEYEGYFNSEYAGSGWLGISYYTMRALIFYLFTYIAYSEKEKEESLAISNSIFLLLIVCLGFSVNSFDRASLYFLLITVIELTNTFYSGNIKHKSIWMLATGVIMLAYFMVVLWLRPGWNYLYPFEFMW